MQKPTEARWLTYAELAELMDASTEAARAFANRLELRKQRGNDDKARVYVEPDILACSFSSHPLMKVLGGEIPGTAGLGWWRRDLGWAL